MGGKCSFSHTNPCDIRFKIYRLPDFNMLFQLVLTKFFKGELFAKLTTLIDASQIDVFDLLIKVRLFQINVHRLLTLNLLCTLSGKRLTPVNRSNYFRVYRKLFTGSTNAKGLLAHEKQKHLDVTTCLHTLMQTRLSANESARTILVIL